jgi:hypothetical protein
VEKIFGNHVFLLPHLKDPTTGQPIPAPGGPYFDASYGVTYSGLPAFVNSAVAGLVVPGAIPGYPNSRIARPASFSDPVLFQLCLFAGSGSGCTAPTLP